MLGISEGCRHASDKNGFYSVHSSGKQYHERPDGEAEVAGKLCFFGSPLFVVKWFYFVMFLPLTLLIHEKNFAVAP